MSRGPWPESDDTILPSQYHALRASRGPALAERRLMLAVLEDVLRDILKHAGVKHPRARYAFREAMAWCRNRDREWLFSFERICEALEIDPDYLRRKLEELGARMKVPIHVV